MQQLTFLCSACCRMLNGIHIFNISLLKLSWNVFKKQKGNNSKNIYVKGMILHSAGCLILIDIIWSFAKISRMIWKRAATILWKTDSRKYRLTPEDIPICLPPLRYQIIIPRCKFQSTTSNPKHMAVNNNNVNRKSALRGMYNPKQMDIQFTSKLDWPPDPYCGIELKGTKWQS